MKIERSGVERWTDDDGVWEWGKQNKIRTKPVYNFEK